MLLIAFIKKLCPGLTTLQQTGRMLKLLSFCLLAAALQLSARSTAAQGLSLSFTNAGLPAVFNAIQQQTLYRFVYTNEQVAAAAPVTINVQNASLEKVLDICFKDQPLTYSLEDKFIIVKTKEKKTIDALPAENEVRGRVSNENNEGIAGASVAVKGSSRGVSTDGKGSFVLPDVAPGVVMVISSIGYETREIIIGNNRNLDIRLRTAVNALDEMVIKGYYNTSKRLNTGSVSKVGAEVISQQPVSNVLGALEGRMPGVYITQSNGLPGSAYTIQIRGQNSLRTTFSNNGNLPLYVVDGVPYSSIPLGTSYTSSITQGGNPLNNINPSDIESIEVLKDADATAIYGSRGANGVVLVTTKKATAGKLRLTVDAFAGMGKLARKLKLLDTPDYLTMRKEAFKNDGALPDPATDYDLLAWDSTRSTDWQKELLGGTAQFSNVSASVAAGNAHTQFTAGGTYYRESTVYPGDFGDRKGSFHFNLGAQSENKKFNLQLSGNYLSDNNRLPKSDLVQAAISLAPNAPTGYKPDGSLNWQPGFSNPFAVLEQQYRGNTSNLVGNAVLGYQLLPQLLLKTNLGYTSTSMEELNKLPLASFDPAYGGLSGYALFGNTSNHSWIAEPQVEFNKSLGKSKFRALAGGAFHELKRNSTVLYGDRFAQDALLENIAAAGSLAVRTADKSVYRYNSVFIRLNYEWNNKFLLNLTGRRDGSSRFGPGKKFGNFGAVGAAWIFSREQWLQPYTWLSFGKLRGSFGATGNDQIGDYKYLNSWTPTQNSYQSPGLYPTSLLNPDYGWETNRKMEMALELGFLKDRILFTGAWYRNTSSNQLLGYPLPLSTGFSAVVANLPATVRNSGWEFDISAGILQTTGIRWNTSFNLSIPRNELVAFPGLAASSYANSLEIGKSLYIQKLFHYQGVDPQTGLFQFTDVANKNITPYPNYPDDLLALSSISQSYFGGWQNSLRYRNWQFDLFFQFVKQTGYNYWNNAFTVPGMMGNQPAIVMQRWQKPGDITGVQQFTQDYGSAATGAFNTGLSDYAISDASFVRLKNISIAWNLPASWKKSLSLLEGSFYLRAQNLLTITGYKGLDPETQRFDHLPPLRVWVAGIKIML